jgi:Bacterial type II/III secretion system short domain
MNTSTRGKHLISRALRVAAAIAAVAWMPLHCGTISAQSPQPRPKTETETHKTPQMDQAQARALEQLAHGIEGLEFGLHQMRERFGPNDPRVLQAEKELAKLLELQKRFLQLSQGESNESTKAEISRLVDEISAATALKRPEPSPDQLAGLQQELQQMKQQLAEREKQFATMAKQMAEQHRQQPLPPLENGQLKVFSLVAVPARAAGQTIESLFGSQVLRIAIDERSNSLIVYGKSDSLAAVEALLSRLDEQAAVTPGGEKSKQSAAAAPRSVLLRVFWLADGQPEGAGQNPADFLPKSVLLATNKLGLEAPRLVTQTVNSLAVGREDASFSTNVPAVLLDQPARLDCDGRLKLVSGDRVQLEMRVQVGGPAINCELRGSLATPLGHYMVLGTANSVMAEGGVAAGAMAGGPGMGPGVPGGGGRFGAGRPGQGFRGGPEGGPGLGATAGPDGGAGPGAAPAEAPGGPGAGEQATKPNFKSSRFAFVVQVIEGQSYPADKDNSGSQLPPPPH